ncbi:MAG: putative LPS assembly protein LptD [Candidatus Omnitrophota bacterium]
MNFKVRLFLITVIIFLFFTVKIQAEDNKKIPIIINGDVVEYLAEDKKVSATGNVEVIYQNTKLKCDKITVFTETKEGIAEGHVKVEDAKGTIFAEKIVYNFETQTGKLVDANFIYLPFYGKAESMTKAGPNELDVDNGYITSCDRADPHYRIRSKQIQIFPGDRVTAKNVVFLVGKMPILYIPKFSQSLKKDDRRPSFSITPGHSSEWGMYVLSYWRYKLNENVKGKLRLDWRDRKGFAPGLDINYKTKQLGEGNLRFYYINERDGRNGALVLPEEMEKYRIQGRHRWQIDKKTLVIGEIDKYRDKNFIKDYFYREYEKNMQPRSYILLTHTTTDVVLSALMQKRVNRFNNEIERLPELKLETFNSRIGQSPIYYKSQSSVSNLTHKFPSPTDLKYDNIRFDTYQQFSLPQKIFFLEFTPFVGARETYFRRSADRVGADVNKDINRFVFYTGASLSTKFYRVFDVKSKFLGIEINKLRHIITPSIGTSYNHEPTFPSARLIQFDEVDNIARNHGVGLSLENRLQTKRTDAPWDLVRFLINTSYSVKPEGSHSQFGDVVLDLEMAPYSWLRLYADATINVQKLQLNTVPITNEVIEIKRGQAELANFDMVIAPHKDFSFGGGYRYQKEQSSLITGQVSWTATKNWKFRMYERFEAETGDLQEQEYAIVRDLHCWTMEVTLNKKKFKEYFDATRHKHHDETTIWVILKLKAFPDVGLNFETGYNSPRTQS